MPLPDFVVPGQSQKVPGPGAGMPINPVEQIQKNHLLNSEKEKLRRASAVYGIHAPMRMLMERNILSQHRRLPGLRSNMVGLSEVMGIDDDIEPEDMFYQQDECPVIRSGVSDLHSMMEERLGMNRDINEVTNLNLTENAYRDFTHSLQI
jgi:proteasome maturation protein